MYNILLRILWKKEAFRGRAMTIRQWNPIRRLDLKEYTNSSEHSFYKFIESDH